MDRNHTYMEIGAHDGVRESNSRFYDVCLGWNGLLVEPHPKNYERTVQLRPNAHHLGIAPSCMANETGTISFPEHMYTSAQVNEEGSKLEIHCGPLQHYLDALGIHHVDFWSLDVEGSELNVLKTVDFDRTLIDVIIAESDNRLRDLPEFQQKVRDVRIFLQSKGYLMLSSVKVHKSDVFLHKGSCSRHGNIAECKADEAQTQQSIEPAVVDAKQVAGSNEIVVTCESTPCNGFFAYSGPNRNTTAALEVMRKAVATYNYGGDRNNETLNKMIFMPSETDPQSCVNEWKESRHTWVDR